jgi:hypothetical protein
VARIQQLLVQTSDQGTVAHAHTWYQSEVPNIIKLDPNAAKVYEDHAAILQEVATNQSKLSNDPILTPAQAQGIRSGYQKLVDESAASVAQLTNLANSKTTLSEAEQRTFVGGLAAKENRQLALVKYFTRRSAAVIDQETRKKNQKKINREVWGM